MPPAKRPVRCMEEEDEVDRALRECMRDGTPPSSEDGDDFEDDDLGFAVVAVGQEAKHDLLGAGTVLANFDTKEVVDGCGVTIDDFFVDELCSAIPMLLGNSIALKAELAVYLVSARGHPGLDESDVHSFTDGVLKFWRENGNKMKAWSDAARIVFAIPPNSAASERVFALLADMFWQKDDLMPFRLHPSRPHAAL